jgi:hypothetical protein
MLRAAATPRDRQGGCPECPAGGQLCPKLGQNPDTRGAGVACAQGYEARKARVNTIAEP